MAASYPDYESLEALEAQVRVISDLYQLEMSKEEIAERFIRGHLRVGLSNNLLWSPKYEALAAACSTKGQVKAKNLRLEKALDEEEKVLRQVEDELKTLKLKQVNIQGKIAELRGSLQQGNEHINKIRSLEPLLETAEKVKDVELEMATAIEAQMYQDKNEYSALSECSDSPKLSLIFNTFGLSPKVISRLADLDAFTFLTSHNLTDLLIFNGITDFETRKDLCYIQHMMQQGQLPPSETHDECPVCICETYEELQDLLEEYELNFPFKWKNLTGKRAMFLEYSDLCTSFGNNQSKVQEAMNISRQLRKIHNGTLSTSRIPCLTKDFTWTHKGPYRGSLSWVPDEPKAEKVEDFWDETDEDELSEPLENAPCNKFLDFWGDDEIVAVQELADEQEDFFDF